MIIIDGSHGEGGGQILRTALALSAVRRQPFRIVNIRANRKKPGLMPQHLAAVRAAKDVANAEVTGDHTGSKEVSFVPGEITGGSFRFDIGTAGSASLVLQTVIPILLTANRNSSITVTGGTNLPFSPSADYLDEIFAPSLQKIGCTIRLHKDHYGFYPRGGGKLRAEVYKPAHILPMDLMHRGRLKSVTGWSAVGNLSDGIAERQRRKVLELLKAVPCPVDVERIRVDTIGPGSFIFLRLAAENSLAGFQALGAPGKPAEVVGAEAAGELLSYLEAGAALDQHLADQIVLYLAMADGSSAFTTQAITRHLLTNLWVLQQFDACDYTITGEEGAPGTIRISGARH